MAKDIDMQAYADRFREYYRIREYSRINNTEQDVKSLVSKLVTLAKKNYPLLDDELELITNYKLTVLEKIYTGISKLSFIYLYVYKNPDKSITQLKEKLIDKDLYAQCCYDDAKYRKQLKLKLEKEVRQRDRLSSLGRLSKAREELSQAYESIKSIDEDTERNKARHEKLKLRQLELDNIQIKLEDRQRQRQGRIVAKHAGLRSYRPFKGILDSGENGNREHIDDIMNECKALGVAYLADAYIRNNPTKTLEEIKEALLNKELIEYAFKSKHKYRTLLKFKLQKRLIDNTEIFKKYKIKDAAKNGN